MKKIILSLWLLFAPEVFAASITPVDQYGQPCVKNTGAKHNDIPRYLGGPIYTKYIVKFSNSCNKSFTVYLYTTNGGKSYLDLPAGSERDAFCTDGLSVNNDCGGFNAWEVR